MVTEENFEEKYPPVIVFFPLSFYKDQPKLLRYKRNRNYEGNVDKFKDRVYIRHTGQWVPIRYCQFVDFSYNEKLIVLHSVMSTPLEAFDIVESLTGMKYDRDYGGYYSKVRRWPDEEPFVVSVEQYLRPVNMLGV